MDMNIIIRTAVLTPTENLDEWRVRVGAGGAITALSVSSDEYEEMMLKASTVMSAVNVWALGGEVEAQKVASGTMANAALPSSPRSANRTTTMEI